MSTVQERKEARRKSYKYFLPAFAAGFFGRKNFFPSLFPHGSAVRVAMKDRAIYSPVDPSKDDLQLKSGKLKKIYERFEQGQDTPLLRGPETVIFDPDTGSMYVLTEDSNLVKLDNFQQDEQETYKITARTTLMKHMGVGRQLGGKMVSGGTLYAADVLLGLTRVENFNSPNSKVELLASSVEDVNGTWSQILFADDVAVGSETGMVYFSDASSIAPDRVGTETWDFEYASKADYGRGKRTGRLLRYNPKTHSTEILASGIWFANGIALDKDETFVMISETFAGRTLKYHLVGDKKGQLEVMADQFPGYPDGADCSDTHCYTPIFVAEDKIMHFVWKLPHPLDAFIRNLLLMAPKSVLPKATPYGGVIKMPIADPTNYCVIQDPKAQDIGDITGVTVHENKLYLASIRNNFIGVYDLN